MQELHGAFPGRDSFYLFESKDGDSSARRLFCVFSGPTGRFRLNPRRGERRSFLLVDGGARARKGSPLLLVLGTVARRRGARTMCLGMMTRWRRGLGRGCIGRS